MTRVSAVRTVLETDIDGNGANETVVADKTTVKIYNIDGTMRVSFSPFGDKWKNGMEIAFGDVNNDGANEIVVGANAGGQPLVKIFNLAAAR